MNSRKKGVHLDIYLVMRSIIGIMYDIVVRNQLEFTPLFFSLSIQLLLTAEPLYKC